MSVLFEKPRQKIPDFQVSFNFFCILWFYDSWLEVCLIFHFIIIYSEISFGKGLYCMEIQSLDFQSRSIKWFLYFCMLFFYWKVFLEAYPEMGRASVREIFMKIVDGFLSLAIFTENSVSDVWLGSECWLELRCHYQAYYNVYYSN